MESFDLSDHGEQVKEIDSDETFHRSIGLCWNLKTDTFMFTVPTEEKPFTQHGLLSTVNSLFDPLGFMAPKTVSGKILLREATPRELTGTNLYHLIISRNGPSGSRFYTVCGMSQYLECFRTLQLAQQRPWKCIYFPMPRKRQ